MLTGDSFNVSKGMSMDFVDCVLPQDEDAESTLQGIMQRLSALNNLQGYKAITDAQGDLHVTLVKISK